MITKTVSFLGTALDCEYTVDDEILEFLYVGIHGHKLDLRELLTYSLLGRVDPASGGLGVTPLLSVLAEILEPSPSAASTVAEVGSVPNYQIH